MRGNDCEHTEYLDVADYVGAQSARIYIFGAIQAYLQEFAYRFLAVAALKRLGLRTASLWADSLHASTGYCTSASKKGAHGTNGFRRLPHNSGAVLRRDFPE